MNNQPIELVIVATRRPDLLERCLASFSEKVFKNFDISRVLVNIDPVWGGAIEHKKVLNLLESQFENLTIFEPKEAGFTGAVKRLWEHTENSIVFHLEEDWICLRDVNLETVKSNLNETVTSLVLMSETKNNKKNFEYHFRRFRPWYLPFKIQDKKKPHFSTSPSFWDGSFLRECANLMDERFDPEKQFYSGINIPLEEFVSDKKCKFLFGNPHMVKDIGRDWQNEHRIRKQIKNGVTFWEPY